MGTVTPLGAVVRGLVAGVLGTLAMDTLWYVRYRRGGGTEGFRPWEFAADVKTWDDASAPGQVGRRLFEGLFQRKLPDAQARLVTNITHWAYGVGAAGAYGLIAGSLPAARIAYGPVFGSAVWATSYAVLPAAGLYQPIWKYDRATLAKDLSAHLLFGTTTAAAFAALSGRPRGGS
jgi:hypothetical protein